jgi:Fe2+ or Zn2+ uptake regulation protein
VGGELGAAATLIAERLRRLRTASVDTGYHLRVTAVDRLDQAGARLTEPRRRLAALIDRQPGPFSAADLLEAAESRAAGIGRATVFRTLALLEAEGVIERIDLPGGEHAYVACARGHHHHAVCIVCGRVTDLPDLDVGVDVGALSRRSGYDIESHRIELFGRCPECRRAASANSGMRR